MIPIKKETKKSMDFFVNKFLSSTIIEVQEIGKSLSNRYDEIVNAYAKNEYGFCLTNTVAESNNNYIKELIHISHGFTNFTRFRKRILYIKRKKSPQYVCCKDLHNSSPFFSVCMHILNSFFWHPFTKFCV